MVQNPAPAGPIPSAPRNQSGQTIGPKGRRTRQRLIAETIAQLETRRLRELRIADIARAAEIAPGTFYLYFEDVADVVLAAIEEAARDTSDIVALASGDWQGDAALETAQRLVRAYLSYWDQHHALFRVRNLAAEEGDQRFVNARLKSMLPLLQALERQVDAAQRAGTLPSNLLPLATAGALLAMLERLASVHRLNQRSGGSSPGHVAESAAFIIAQTLRH
ncbi:TetR family transcriptional regulator [Sphingomonas sp. IC4-52]|uniref:TetR family transcriptional regulator n=1 Tax=Sphingomonas sp. IC4-52 TaxID=2887202 RepID=UPI001D108B6F|nr:TetR family transcriptional regulator [Sphingomonas sp. IC4-52]MCC2980288.1 TetR/AcrR family transcriptional regulator [Sphingomonas sp. IC4-52]